MENEEAEGQDRVSSGHGNTRPYVYSLFTDMRTHEHSHWDHRRGAGFENTCVRKVGLGWVSESAPGSEHGLVGVTQRAGQLETHHGPTDPRRPALADQAWKQARCALHYVAGSPLHTSLLPLSLPLPRPQAPGCG